MSAKLDTRKLSSYKRQSRIKDLWPDFFTDKIFISDYKTEVDVSGQFREPQCRIFRIYRCYNWNQLIQTQWSFVSPPVAFMSLRIWKVEPLCMHFFKMFKVSHLVICVIKKKDKYLSKEKTVTTWKPDWYFWATEFRTECWKCTIEQWFSASMESGSPLS